MKNTIKLVAVLVVIILVSVISLIVQHNKQSQSNVDVEVKEKSDQEKAEEFAEKMKPKIEERLHEEDIHNFIKTITFKKNVSISPMGYVTVDGYINNEPDKYHFSASLIYKSNEIGSMSHSPDLSDRFENWDDFDPQVKEDFLNSLSKKEREQYLKDIGEKE
ncbi:DUF1433 domain-containing protein [Bacillus safensis]|uniref:DUF1433 domain-containing protein n=1 Tax=Bacillus TaxID=1386 RepID=UPI0005805E60|nr:MULTISPECIES: DUF1433 domain-containing protein [Bacillus]AIZ62347.1 secreted lipoprotein [Bacillus sp. WP8]MCM3138450.1 DUF1433 domain-containing protein [Bacillus safensis]PCK10386.1 DUF1433 domain-containing protein [Bacillus safensis]UXC32403.1 DUF1433 domain-containing protein [Bacillus safensis]